MENIWGRILDFFADDEEEAFDPGSPEYFIALADRAYEEKRYPEALDNYCAAVNLGSELAANCLAEMYSQNLIKTPLEYSQVKASLKVLSDRGSSTAAQILEEINSNAGIAGKIYRDS